MTDLHERLKAGTRIGDVADMAEQAALRLHDAIRMAVVSRLRWIRRKRRQFLDQPRQSARQMVTGESHWFRGRRYRLDVCETTGRTHISLRHNRWMTLYARPNADRAARHQVLDRWHREQMRALLPDLLARWQPVMGKKVAECRIKRMKTR